MGIFDGLFGKRKKPARKTDGGDAGGSWMIMPGDGGSGGKKGAQPDTDAGEGSGGSDGGGSDGGGGGGGGD